MIMGLKMEKRKEGRMKGMKEFCKWVMPGVVIIALFWAGGQASKQLEAVILERDRLLLELETLTEEQVELEQRLTELKNQRDDLIRSIQERDSLERRLEEFLERFEVRRVTVTAYAPFDPRAVEGMCYSGNPNVTASGSPPVPGLTAAGGKEYRFGTRVWVEGYG